MRSARRKFPAGKSPGDGEQNVERYACRSEAIVEAENASDGDSRCRGQAERLFVAEPRENGKAYQINEDATDEDAPLGEMIDHRRMLAYILRRDRAKDRIIEE